MVASLALLAVLGGAALAGADGPVPEDQVKAAFLFNFLKFVEWPGKAGEGPWVMGVVGPGEFANLLEQTVANRMVSGRKVIVRRFRRAADVKDCHILFIPRDDFDPRVAVPARAGLLTVGESQGFVEAGGVINLYVESNKVRFEIRVDAARAAGLRILPQLLSLGTIR
jgi:hypothetical protein